MHGPTCICWANRTPLSLAGLPAVRARVPGHEPRHGPGPPKAVKHPHRSPQLNRFCMAALYGRAGRLTAKNGGFRPGQKRGDLVIFNEARVGLGRAVALCHRSSTLYQIH
jgi:hypothetical protein